MLACPSISDTIFEFTFFSKRIVAAVWHSSHAERMCNPRLAFARSLARQYTV